MLVLSRKFGQRIVVPGLAITVTVLAIEGGKVQLGITAPDAIEVYREEVWSRISKSVPEEKKDLPEGN